jgi:Na+/H+-dicarboxylate symporter
LKNNTIPLWQQVLFALVAGALTGMLLGPQAKVFGYFGVIFLNLIKMVTVPMIVFSIIYGMTSIDKSPDLYRISFKALSIFLLTSLIAVSIGLLVPIILKPGVGISKNILNNLNIGNNTIAKEQLSVVETLVNLIPTNIFEALAGGNILQVIIFAFLFGIVLQSKRDESDKLIALIHQAASVFFNIIQIIMRLSPFGVFGYIAAIVGVEGVDVLLSLGSLVLTIFIGCLLQYIVYLVLILVIAKISPLPFIKKILGAQMLAFATSSSKATLVPLMEMAENDMGISKQKSRFLFPLSAALNMDGGAIYQASATLFIAQIIGMDLNYSHYITLFLMCTLASVGGAGVPGGVLLFLGMVLNSVGLPMEAVLLIASIDRILDMMTTVINVTGCGCVTLITDQSERTLNLKKYYNKSNSKKSI